MRALACVLVLSAAAGAQSIGTVGKSDASITGNLQTSGDATVILTGGVVDAKARATEVKLTRGGTVRVCQMSALNMTASTAAKAPLMLALNHGAFEMHMVAQPTDAILTPDLRIDLSNAAPLDLRIRVTPNGDTCVENRGKDAPSLHVTSQFGVGGYFVAPGQHVMFEHGSVQEVVDRESSPCGCPASGTVLAGNSTEPNPFPEAVSQGLEEPKVPQATPGQTHTEVALKLSYNGRDRDNGAATAATPSSLAASAGGLPQQPESSRAQQPSKNPFRAIGHFFQRIFGGP